MDIQLDHLGSNSGFNQSRFALQFVVVSDVDDFDKNRNLTWQTTTSLDDEHTPGIFKVTTGLGVDIINCFAPYDKLLRHKIASQKVGRRCRAQMYRAISMICARV